MYAVSLQYTVHVVVLTAVCMHRVRNAVSAVLAHPSTSSGRVSVDPVLQDYPVGQTCGIVCVH